jgi:aminoglycoside 6'-N-acetyltransferase
MAITFRALTEADFPLMFRWLNTPLLLDIWSNGRAPVYEEMAAKYLRYIRGEKPTLPFIIEVDGVPVGYIQTYLWRDWENHLELTEEAASLDVFIGEEAYRGRGIGPAMLRQFMREEIFARWPEVASCVIVPEAANEQAIRAYEKAGCTRGRVFHPPDEERPIIMMRVGRDELLAG